MKLRDSRQVKTPDLMIIPMKRLILVKNTMLKQMVILILQ